MIKYLKNIFNPRPSLFDICVAGFVFIPWIKTDFTRSLFIIFYTVFLLSLSFVMKPKREYRSLPLTLITLWSLVGLFIHSFAIYPSSLTYQYKIFYLMVEGFLYVLFGIIFIKTTISYTTNPRFIYFLFPFTLMPWYKGLIHVGSSTPIVALCISIVIYLFLSRRFRIAIPISILGLLGIIYKWSWLVMKFRCRPYIWYQLLINSFYHPQRGDGVTILDPGIQFSPFMEKFVNAHPYLLNIKPWLVSIFGSGFSQYLNSDYTWVDFKHFGWVHNQNDYLSLACCLGPVALILLGWFIVQSVKTIGIRPVLITFMSIMLICFGQLTMFNPGKAGICLTIISVTIAEGLRRKV